MQQELKKMRKNFKSTAQNIKAIVKGFQNDIYRDFLITVMEEYEYMITCEAPYSELHPMEKLIESFQHTYVDYIMNELYFLKEDSLRTRPYDKVTKEMYNDFSDKHNYDQLSVMICDVLHEKRRHFKRYQHIEGKSWDVAAEIEANFRHQFIDNINEYKEASFIIATLLWDIRAFYRVQKAL